MAQITVSTSLHVYTDAELTALITKAIQTGMKAAHVHDKDAQLALIQVETARMLSQI
ncbi:hypothetical protein Q9323_15045 [Pseudomonas fulva]|uniref:hypothetical protein n=1 Tax=Pseudomonas fulva TaxID=47880 RepID=UPI0031F6A775